MYIMSIAIQCNEVAILGRTPPNNFPIDMYINGAIIWGGHPNIATSLHWMGMDMMYIMDHYIKTVYAYIWKHSILFLKSDTSDNNQFLQSSWLDTGTTHVHIF